MAYRLELPPTASIHPIFHVSLLKKVVGPLNQVSVELPVFIYAFQVPTEVLNCRVISQGNKTVAQVLVRWSSWPKSLSTWEDELMLRQKFPDAPAWGQSRD